jgi:glycosyltransferase involved in cell wall biosynthesis
VVFSLTTHSLVAHEMMASGLPTVELEGENVGSALGPPGELVEQVARRPDAIADAIERLVSDAAERERLRRAGRANAARFTWEEAAKRTLRTYDTVFAYSANTI